VTRLDGTVPDGVAFTADGDVLVSCYRRDRSVHLDEAGVVEIIAANFGRWHLALVHSGLHGIPLHYPTTWAADA
jgi:hypothetical protein